MVLSSHNLFFYTTSLIGTFSVIGSFLVCIACTIFVPLKKSFAFNLVFWLCFSDCCFNFGIAVLPLLIGENQSDTAWECQFQAFISSFFPIASLLWVAVIMWCVSRVVVHRMHTRSLQQSMWRFHFVVWVRLLLISHYCLCSEFTQGRFLNIVCLTLDNQKLW